MRECDRHSVRQAVPHMDDAAAGANRHARVMTSRHAWRAHGARLLAIGTALSVLTSCGSRNGTSSDTHGATRVGAKYYGSEYGVRVGIRVGYSEAREVTGARLVTSDASADVSLYPLDGTDPDPPPESISLEPGEQVLLEGTLLVPCAGTRETPVFEVSSESDGSQQTDRFAPADTDGYHRAVATWCDRPLTMHVTRSMVTPAGVYELGVEFINPGADPVTVISARVHEGSSSWKETAVVVPAGGTAHMTIHGQGPPGCAATPPWETGHVRADGQVIRPESDDWC